MKITKEVFKTKKINIFKLHEFFKKFQGTFVKDLWKTFEKSQNFLKDNKRKLHNALWVVVNFQIYKQNVMVEILYL